mgnify:CR=1 FL=1
MPALYKWRNRSLSRALTSDLKELFMGDTMAEIVVHAHYDELYDLKDNKDAMQWIGIDSNTYKKAIKQGEIVGSRSYQESEDSKAEWSRQNREY